MNNDSTKDTIKLNRYNHYKTNWESAHRHTDIGNEHPNFVPRSC